MTDRTAPARATAYAFAATAALLGAFLSIAPPAHGQDDAADAPFIAAPVFQEFSGEAAIEGRFFFNPPAFSGQRRNSGSIYVQPEYYVEWDDYTSITFVGFGRWDSADPNRTHVDLRELFLKVVGDDWELGAGVGKVFWGVTESVHLVDIINQTDAIENVDLEDKLGQPLIDLTLIRDWGYLDFFYMPYARDRTFQSRKGRLRSGLVVDTGQTRFSHGAERWYPSVAMRYSNSFGAWDVGLAGFHGVSREPTLSPGLNSTGDLVLIPEYERINQLSADIQYTTGAWLWKLESYFRQGEKDANGAEKNYGALVGGFEYTLYGVLDSVADVGLLVEYLRDTRLNSSPRAFQNDVFAGVRLAFNDPEDTQILAGVVQDLQRSTRLYSLEASRRVGDSWKLTVEARLFSAVEAGGVFDGLRDDDFVQIELGYFF